MTSRKQNSAGIVYSTDPNFKLVEPDENQIVSIIPASQKLKVQLDKKHRAGKAVTLISGYIGATSEIEILGKKLKSFCGCGGSVKDGEIIVQGDNRIKILMWLKNNGFSASKMI